MEKQMKKIGYCMNVLMGLVMSFSLSLFGMLESGHFSVPGWIISFIVSFLISLVIGFVIPMRRLTVAINEGLHIENNIAKTFLEALISNICYTPIITTVMVVMALLKAHAPLPMALIHALPKSLVLSFILGYILILIFQTVFIKILTSIFLAPNKEQ